MNLIVASLLADVLAPPRTPVLPSSFLENKPLLIGSAVGAGLFFLLTIIWLSRGKKKVDPEGGLTENLATYPPAPAAGRRRLTVQGQEGRLRLVVIAPVGRKVIESGDVETLLNQVLRGLGDIAKQDKPRVRIWQPQLSSQGFAPTFHRLTHRPEPAGKASPWVLLAGPAQAEGQQILLGLAVYADRANKLEQLTLKPLEWGEVLTTEAV